MLADRPLSIALRRRGLPAGSPPPALAATEISRMILVKILPRRASSAFLRASMEGPLPIGIQPGTLGKAGILTFREAALAQEGDGLGGRLGGAQQAPVDAFAEHVAGEPIQTDHDK